MKKTNLYHIYPTMKCNLDCQHCFLVSEVRRDTSRMSVEDFKTVVDKMASHFKSDASANFADVTIIGGEPTTVPAKFYTECLPYLRETFDAVGKKYLLSIVTNFVVTKQLKQYADLFDVVSTSYEYDRFEGQQQAIYATKKDLWWQNVRDWVSEGRKVAVSLSTSKNTTENAKKIFDLLYDNGIRYFQIQTMHPDGELIKNITLPNEFERFSDQRHSLITEIKELESPLALDPNQDAWGGFEAEAKFMKEVTQWWMEKLREGETDIEIFPIGSHMESLLTGVGDDETKCPTAGALCVRTDGSVTSCTIEAGQKEMLSYGNLIEQSVEDIMSSELRVKHVTALNASPIVCYGCEYYFMCRGGCKFRENFWDKSLNNECPGLRGYLAHIKEFAPEFLKLRKNDNNNNEL